MAMSTSVDLPTFLRRLLRAAGVGVRKSDLGFRISIQLSEWHWV